MLRGVFVFAPSLAAVTNHGRCIGVRQRYRRHNQRSCYNCYYQQEQSVPLKAIVSYCARSCLHVCAVALFASCSFCVCCHFYRHPTSG